MKSKKLFISLLITLFSVFLFVPTHSYALESWAEEYVDLYNSGLSAITASKNVMATVYLCDSYDVKSSPSGESSTVTTIYSGQLVLIEECGMDDSYGIWYKVNFSVKGTEYEGYIERSYLAISDEDFLKIESDDGMLPEYWDFSNSMMLMSIDSEEDDDSEEADISGDDPEITYSADVLEFPESYRDALQSLKDDHPNWTFVKVSTGLDFSTSVQTELLANRSQVYGSFDACCKEAQVGTINWYYPSEEILAYYMDPRNGLSESMIFQFEQLTYNESYHTQAALESYLNTTYMKSTYVDENGDTQRIKAPDQDITYADIIWNISKVKGISPFFAASKILQENGNPTNALISGTYSGFEHYYNYFNIGATGSTTEEIILNGLNYAKNHWSTGSYSSIEYGINLLGNSYILQGQDTPYFQKYNVSPSATAQTYHHQYLQNISAARTEGYKVYTMYSSSGSLNNAFVFKIPVYENMPDTACEKPTSTTKAIIYLPSDATDNGVTSTPSVWIDGVECSSVTRNGYLVVDTGNQTSTNAVVYKYNDSGSCTGMYVWFLSYSDGAYTVTYESDLEDLLMYHGFSVRVTGNSGIRFKSSISTSLKSTLISTGVDGYKLNEYGTICMNNANRSTYPFVKDGAKVISGLAYGTDSSGNHVDKVFETVDGRARFTSVLVDLPATRYKTEYAFRSYIVLSNGSRNITLYGIPMARSIYYLSNKLISMNYYTVGSDADLFLRQIISDADSQ